MNAMNLEPAAVIEISDDEEDLIPWRQPPTAASHDATPRISSRKYQRPGTQPPRHLRTSTDDLRTNVGL